MGNDYSELAAAICAQNEIMLKALLAICSETPEQRAERERREAEEWEIFKGYFEHRCTYDGEEKVFYHC